MDMILAGALFTIGAGIGLAALFIGAVFVLAVFS